MAMMVIIVLMEVVMMMIMINNTDGNIDDDDDEDGVFFNTAPCTNKVLKSRHSAARPGHIVSVCTPPLYAFFTIALLFVSICSSKTLYKCKCIHLLDFLHLVDKEQESCLCISSNLQSETALERKLFENHIGDSQFSFF